MHFLNTTICLSSLLMATASASAPTFFEVPGSAPSTVVAPEINTTTTVYETSTTYLTSAVTVTSARTNSTVGESSSCTDSAPAIITPSLYVTGTQTFVPVTLWEGNTTRVIFPQNSTALENATGYPGNGGSSVVVTGTVSSSSSSKTAATTPQDKTSATATASASASVSEVPVNGAGKAAGTAVLGLGAVAGFMVLL